MSSQMTAESSAYCSASSTADVRADSCWQPGLKLLLLLLPSNICSSSIGSAVQAHQVSS